MAENTAEMARVPRFFQEPSGSYFLFGPRGTGKSTWLQSNYPETLWFDLLDPEVARAHAARPERLLAAVRGNPDKPRVVIDEIQKVPALLDAVHLLMEEDPKRRFALTGSSARKLRRAGVDLLAGRALVTAMHPFMAAELPAFDLESTLRLGLLPLVWKSPHPEKTLAAYVAVYIREEVQAESLVRSVDSFARFVEAISFSHAAVLSLTDVARECQVSRKTVEGYLSILEDLLLGFRLPVFRRRAQRQMTKRPKFYWFDCGVFAAIRPKGPLDRPSEIGGAALEGLVAQHLRAWIDYSGSDARLFFWRTKSGNEVDFVVYGADVFQAIEVKNSANPQTRDTRSLRSFTQDYPECSTRLLHRGSQALNIEGVRCLPCRDYLRRIIPDQPLP